jgi:hypothetical protein
VTPPTPDTEAARQRGPAVPRKARPVPETRSDGRAYQSAPTDGRRVRWQRGAGRVRLACRRWERLEAALLARDFAPPSLGLEYHAAFARRVRALLASVFIRADAAADSRRERLPLSAAEFLALRSQLHARLRAARAFTTRERRIIGQRVRDWLNRNFIVPEAAAPATTQGTTP